MKHKLLSLFMALVATTALWASNTITYTATAKLTNSTLTVGSTTFGSAITSHTFSNGTGTITCSGEITTIGTSAFSGCSGLTSVTIPNSVTTIGSNAFYLCKGLTSVTIGNSVTTIKGCAFRACSSLTSVIIPNSVTMIEGYAFDGCSSLTSVTIGNSVTNIGNYAFQNCRGLTSVTIGNSVTTIEKGAFVGCSGLTSVTLNSNAICSEGYSSSFDIGDIFGSHVKEYIIGNSVTTIGNYAFYGCSGLTSVTIGNSVTTIGMNAFQGCKGLTSVTIPNSVTTIGSYAFQNCSGLTGVLIIPNSVTTIGSYAFYGCSGLTSFDVAIDNTHYCSVDGVLFNYAKNILIQYPLSNSRTEYTIPNSVTTIENYAFQNCSGLTSITISNSITTIGNYAFGGCNGLTSVTIGNSVTTIGNSAFIACSGLTLVTLNSNAICSKAYTSSSNIGTIFGSQVKEYIIGNSVTTIGTYAFYQCSSLTSVTIGNSVTTIGENAFYGCSGLTSITIPKSVTTIRNFAFYNCSGLIGALIIPNDVTTIGNNAFNNCRSLTSVTVGNSVTTIGENAFYGCSGLTSITCYATTPPTCGSNCFYNVDKTIPVYVPARSVDAYKKALYWGGFTNIQGNPNDYAIVTCSATNGTIKGGGKYIKGDTCTLTVTSNYSYHFVQWTDRVTDNPRSFVVTQDTTFIAELAINIYSFDVQTADFIMGSVVGTKGNYEHGTSLDVSAQPNYGYHFDHWSDGNKRNPRTITLTKDTVLTAYFAKNTYSVSAPKSQYGSILGTGNYEYLDTCTLTVTPNYGYHFTQWSDGNTENPRSFVVTQDTTFFTAQLDKNQYLISVEAEHGEANGSGYYEYLSSAQISVTADEHYHFVKWSDGNTSNPRTVSVTGDKTYTAICTIDQFAITATATNGVVNGTGKYDYGKEITLIVVPNFCHEFAGWSDGNMDNPRKVTVLENAQYTAQCKRMQVAQGTCGYNVYWTLDLTTGVLTISGNGAMTDYTSANQTPWYDYLNYTTFTRLIIEDGVTHIGNYAFYGYEELTIISLPNSVETIGNYAFAECQNLEKVSFGAGLQSIGNYAFYNDIRIEEMTCLANRTPDVMANTFTNVSHYAWVFVQSEYFHKYEVNMYWNVFVLKTIEAEPAVVQEDDVTVTPSTDNATIVWPSDDAAAEYTLEITKDGVVFCTLRFNAQGQLIGIAFAPSRDGELRTMSNAEMAVNGWSFTVTGLNPGSTYSYTVDVVDAQKQSIHQYTGSFTTTGGVVTSLPTLMSTSASGKMLYNGHLYILRDGNLFNATGARVK